MSVIPKHSFHLMDLFLHLQASTDQSAVDLQIPYQVGAVAFSMIQLLGIIAVMSQVAWQVFIVFIPVIAACIWYQVLLMSPSNTYFMCYVMLQHVLPDNTSSTPIMHLIQSF